MVEIPLFIFLLLFDFWDKTFLCNLSSTWIHYVAQFDPKFSTFLPQSLKCWNYRCELPHLARLSLKRKYCICLYLLLLSIHPSQMIFPSLIPTQKLFKYIPCVLYCIMYCVHRLKINPGCTQLHFKWSVTLFNETVHILMKICAWLKRNYKHAYKES